MPYHWVQKYMDSTLCRSGHSLIGLAKVNVPTLGQGFRINLVGVLLLDVSIPGVRIGNI